MSSTLSVQRGRFGEVGILRARKKLCVNKWALIKHGITQNEPKTNIMSQNDPNF